MRIHLIMVGGQVLQYHIRGAQPPRNIHRAIALAFTSGGYTQNAIAEYFGVHYSIVSRVVKWAEEGKPE